MAQTQLTVKNTRGAEFPVERSHQKEKADARHGISAYRALMLLMRMVELKHKENRRLTQSDRNRSRIAAAPLSVKIWSPAVSSRRFCIESSSMATARIWQHDERVGL